MGTEREHPKPTIQAPVSTSLEQRPETPSSRNNSLTVPGSHNYIYSGSYAPDARRRSALRNSAASAISTPTGSAAPSPRASTTEIHLKSLLRDEETEFETYDLEELRDGFFDAYFHSPNQSNGHASDYLQAAQAKPFSPSRWSVEQFGKIRDFVRQITCTRSGIKLAKSFLSFFIAYIICLIPVARVWLGRYNYFLPLSVILNHSGRTIGAQLDGWYMTTVGAAFGLGWGSLALYVSTSTAPARAGYGGVLAAFLVLFTAFISFVRCTFVRFYQAVISAGIAISYTCLADTSQIVSWHKIFSFGIPWVLGQVIAFTVCTTLFPDAGSRSFA